MECSYNILLTDAVGTHDAKLHDRDEMQSEMHNSNGWSRDLMIFFLIEDELNVLKKRDLTDEREREDERKMKERRSWVEGQHSNQQALPTRLSMSYRILHTGQTCLP